MGRPSKQTVTISAREKILAAALRLIREQGYASTTVDSLCEAAGVTKGTFFHYFETKEALAVAAAQHWSTMTGEFFKTAAYHQFNDPLDRFIGYLEFRKEILKGKVPEFTCLVGTMVQEVYDSNPSIRLACQQSIFGHAQVLEKDIEAAKKLYASRAKWSVKGLALHAQAVIQGAFILAKASGDAGVAIECIDHLVNYVRFLFNKTSSPKEIK